MEARSDLTTNSVWESAPIGLTHIGGLTYIANLWKFTTLIELPDGQELHVKNLAVDEVVDRRVVEYIIDGQRASIMRELTEKGYLEGGR